MTETTDALRPFVLEADAIASARLLVFAASLEAAHEILHDRTDELVDTLITQADLPDNEAVTYNIDVRPAFGSEVAGSSPEYLNPGEFTLDVCSCVDEDQEAA